MSKKKKAIILIGILIITVVAIIAFIEFNNNREFDNNSALLYFHKGNSTVACGFEIGQTREQIETTLDNAGLSYRNSKNKDGVDCILLYDEVAIVGYWFVMDSNNILRRIDADDKDGIGAILPKDYHDRR